MRVIVHATPYPGETDLLAKYGLMQLHYRLRSTNRVDQFMAERKELAILGQAMFVSVPNGDYELTVWQLSDAGLHIGEPASKLFTVFVPPEHLNVQHEEISFPTKLKDPP